MHTSQLRDAKTMQTARKLHVQYKVHIAIMGVCVMQNTLGMAQKREENHSWKYM